MVYCGKPSRGCQNCKTRRIKCDEIRPACTQCRRSGRTCPGYPDEFDLIFRDENAAVVRRVKRSAISKSSSNTPSSRRSPTVSTDPEISSSPSPVASAEDLSESVELIPRQDFTTILPYNEQSRQTYDGVLGCSIPLGLTPSEEAQATAFFFRNFVMIPQQTECMRGFLELLVPYYNRTSHSSALHQATNAVALSALGISGRRELSPSAAACYGKALNMVGEALKDKTTATTDEVLLSIMLFSLYEALSSTRQASSWSNHVDGAVALAKLRGADQFRSPASLNVFQAIRSIMVTSCVQQSKPIEDFPGPRGWAIDTDVPVNAANRLVIICLELPEIRVRSRALLSKTTRDATTDAEALALIEKAARVDASLEIWSQTLPDGWGYRTVAMVHKMPNDVRTAPMWPGPIHVYEDVFIANIINDCRVSRIFCHSVILNCIRRLSPEHQFSIEHDFECQRARYVIQQMVDEISASAPFHMNYDMQAKARLLNQDREAVEAVGGYFLVWAVFVASNAEGVPTAQREWLQGRLFHIGARLGLSSEQVLVLAQTHVLTCGPSFP